MDNEPDIVARLRESDGGYFMRKMFTEAADEIERLRIENEELIDHVESLVAKCEELTLERDEARREVCELRTDIGFSRPLMPHMLEFAASRGWDCFKENNND